MTDLGPDVRRLTTLVGSPGAEAARAAEGMISAEAERTGLALPASCTLHVLLQSTSHRIVTDQLHP